MTNSISSISIGRKSSKTGFKVITIIAMLAARVCKSDQSLGKAEATTRVARLKAPFDRQRALILVTFAYPLRVVSKRMDK
jgi:hypothetical protein